MISIFIYFAFTSNKTHSSMPNDNIEPKQEENRPRTEAGQGKIKKLICPRACVSFFRALQLLRLLGALIVYASSAQLRTGIIDEC